MKKLLSAAVLWTCLFIFVALGNEPIASVRVVAPPALEPGKTVVLVVELQIPSPYHVNSDRPLQDYLKPTILEIDPVPGVTFGNPSFPPADVKKLPFSDSPMSVFGGTVRIAADVTASSGFNSKEIRVSGRVRYQACNDSYCLAPVSQPFSTVLPVGSSLISQTISQTRQRPSAGSSSAAATSNQDASVFGSRGLLVTFMLVFFGGLALNLTPCVYPMIPITITYFGGQAEGKKGSIIAHSGLYVVGMAGTYSILGVVAAMTGGLFGAALQYPAVLIGIAAIMAALALSMFDVYEFRMPQFLNRLAGNSQKGFFGSLLMGLTVGIVAAPCIGPFVLGLLTYVGNKGSVLLGFALFFILALGMGVPFLVLGIFSGSISRLPRSGAWMIWVRKIFGFILLAMAIYFLKSLFPSPLTYHMALAVLMLVAGIYLAWIAAVPGSGRVFANIRHAAGIIIIAAALYAAVTGIQTNAGITQARSNQNHEKAVQWLEYSDSILSRASKESKPVFIDFYADWCAPCKELDERTYSTPEVAERAKQFLMLKVDLTSSDDPRSELLRNKFQIRGVPTLVFLTPKGREIADLRGTGFESKEIFLDKMNRALQSIADK